MPTAPTLTIWDYVFGLGARLAVIGFFCMSGYLIALSIARNIGRFGCFRGKEYAASRALRIVPPLLFAIALAYALYLAALYFRIDSLPQGIRGARATFFDDLHSQAISIVSLMTGGNLTGLLNGPLWSLQYEIQLYVILGLAAYTLLSARAWAVRLIVLGLLALYLYSAFSLGSSNGSVTLQLLSYSMFGLGVATFLFGPHIIRSVRWLIASMALCGATLLFLNYDRLTLINNLDQAPSLIWGQFLFAVGISALIGLIADGRFGSTLAPLGRFSYTLYVVHFPLMLFSYFFLINSGFIYSNSVGWILALVGSCMSIGFAYAVSGFVENAQAQRALLKRLIVPLKGRVE